MVYSEALAKNLLPLLIRDDALLVLKLELGLESGLVLGALICGAWCRLVNELYCVEAWSRVT